jgi:hypothetical protein
MARAYIARCECGNVVGAIVINTRHQDDVAATVAEWIRDGLSVEQVTVKEAQAQFATCKCKTVEVAQAGQNILL